jgi:hypothetical protein
MLKAGKMMWNEIVKANWIRDRRRAVVFIGNLLSGGDSTGRRPVSHRDRQFVSDD